VKVTLRPQLAPGASDPPHAFCTAKSLLPEPVTVTPFTARLASPVLFSVNDWALLALPTAWLAKLRLDADSETRGAVPRPVSVTACGLPGASSIIFREPTKLPVVVGVKLTEIVQLTPAPRETGQLWVAAKSPAAVMPRMARGAFPVLLSVTVCGELGVLTRWSLKASPTAERFARGLAKPTPSKATAWGLEATLSVILKTPVRAPAAVGAKVTEMVQTPPAVRLGRQLFVVAKSPPAEMLNMLSATFPRFASVTVMAALVVPTA
jgi:hypothetical protein